MFATGKFFGRHREFKIRLLIGLVGLGALSLVLAACGGGGSGESGPNKEEVARLRRQGAEHVHKEERLRKVEQELKHIKNTGPTRQTPTSAPPRNEHSLPATPSTSDLESCGGELEVNSYTTCPFAVDVENAYFEEIGSGSGNIAAYSPVTGDTYSMFCTASPHECTGGNNAAVYFP